MVLCLLLEGRAGRQDESTALLTEASAEEDIPDETLDLYSASDADGYTTTETNDFRPPFGIIIFLFIQRSF